MTQLGSDTFEEIKSNRAAVQSSLDYHSDRLRFIARLRREERVPEPRDFPRGFISPAQIFQTAWDTGGETGALAHMEYSTVLELSRLYARQESYELQSGAIGEVIYGELFRGGTSGIMEKYVNLSALIGTFSYRESQLLEQYDEMLAALGHAQPAEATEAVAVDE